MSTTHQTLAGILRQTHPDWSWNQCRKIIHGRRVTVNGVVTVDDVARVPMDADVSVLSAPQSVKKTDGLNVADDKMHVYYLDQHVVVLEKPTDIETVPFTTKKFADRGEGKLPNETLIDCARRWIEKTEGRKIPPLRTVHRLDKGTSGVMVFARTVAAERYLGDLFRRHDITRSYMAYCLGKPIDATITSRLVENRGDGRRGSTANPKLGKEAITNMKHLASRHTKNGQIVSMIQCRLKTGRTHQIRIHLAESGHPLTGEAVYRSAVAFGPEIMDHSGAPRIGLHAHELGFTHPVTGTLMHWQSPVPKELNDWWQNLRS
jgi:23S rRNA pseudouridine1911/1915/1917 synthase